MVIIKEIKGSDKTISYKFTVCLGRDKSGNFSAVNAL